MGGGGGMRQYGMCKQMLDSRGSCTFTAYKNITICLPKSVSDATSEFLVRMQFWNKTNLSSFGDSSLANFPMSDVIERHGHFTCSGGSVVRMLVL